MAAMPDGEPDAGPRLHDLEALLDAAADYEIINLDAEGNIASWNAGAQALLGYAAAEVLGKPVSLFYTDEEQAAGAAEAELRKAEETGRLESEGWRVRKDGQRFWASVITAPIHGQDGSITGYARVTRDISDRHQADVMFRGLLESAPDAIVIAAPDGRIELVNRQAERLFGYSREQLTGQDVEILVPPRFRQRHPRHRDEFFSAARARPMGAGLELSGIRRDGTEFPVEISLSPLETDRGPRAVAAIRDATERREQQQRLRRQRDEIMELSTPVIQLWDKVLALPIIGTLDSARAARLTEGLLEKIAEHQAEVIILDVSGVPTIDTQVAQHLLRTVQAATLMGAASIMSGVRPETAQAIVHLGIDLGRLRTRNTLRDALQLALLMVHERAGVAASAVATVTAGGQT
ncbi:MAG TPA: PAS domain S-box protein [Streptosporangiaceae bacterium]|nr:PAS domain S-box protein [Streptosporangiaceae bacterium]